MAERGSFSSIVEAIDALRPTIIQFDAEHDDLGEIETCRKAGVAPMIKYFGSDPAIFESIIRLRPALINLDRPDVFLVAYWIVTGQARPVGQAIAGDQLPSQERSKA
jgi:glycerophosphoryl diester phosphodiesterase